jgi:cytochrome c oxidase subunit 2
MTLGGDKIDLIFNIIFWLTTVVFIGVAITLTYFIIKYRHKDGVKAAYYHGNNLYEIIWTSIPFVIFVALGIYSNVVWRELQARPVPENAIAVHIVAQQYGWNIRYAGIDGKLGAHDRKNITADNLFGVDKSDPASADDIVKYNELVIPQEVPIHLIMNSKDVIHSFYVPEFRLYQDVVPGMDVNWVWFTTKGPGKFQLACSQLCGTGHYKMKADIKVISSTEYQEWVKTNSPTPMPLPVEAVKTAQQ